MSAKATRFRWIIVALLFFITVVNYIDRSAISYAIEVMRQQFSLTTEQEGMILGAFGLGYFITTLLGGIAVDRYGARHILFYAALIWTVAIGLTGLATGFLMVYLMRLFLGVAEGPNFPAMTRAISDWLSREERASALSYALVAVPIALAIGAPIVTQLILFFNWRGMFFILAGAGLIWLPLWWYFFRDFPQASRHVNEAELQHIHPEETSTTTAEQHLARRQVKGLWKKLFSHPTLLVNNWAFFVFGYYLFFFMTWLPSYLSRVYRFDLTQVGLFSILPWALGALGITLVGRFSDRVFKRTGKLRLARSHPIWISQLCGALCLLPLLFFHNALVAMCFLSLAVGFSLSANALFYAVNVDILKARAGTALGVMDAGFALSGFLAPVITGISVQVTGHFEAAFGVMMLLSLSSVVLIMLFHHPEEKIYLNTSR